ncbi:hypothetical protein HC251_06200 [Iamia sp. SCSIO 61187]|uniref:hypothetical protein n=1 Tax=Iamia sp. SCSIO 61187 TaxID=2722752 RepID=UPI001C6272CA|nr:hypothetical protein [Iamia sp. SCSIO 61187]QYG92070.1 hypothetical protein HC251_06200 [Iamia sp. SCSIO 61187]
MVLASALASAHDVGAWVVVVGNGLAGLWALGAHQRPELRGRALWVFTTVVQVAIFVQVALGVAYQNVEDVEPTEFHTLYGFSGLFGVAILYSYRNQIRDKVHLLYGLGGLFLMGLGIRAMVLHR